MDHSDVREVLEDAAIEPGGLERLMAGDTTTASLIASHLAGCAECTDELERLRRSVGLIRPTLRAVPPPELRERTLAYVAALGRPRGAAAAATEWPLPVPTVPSDIGGERASVASVDRRGSRRGRLAVLTGLAAALLVAVTGTALLVNRDRDTTSRLQTAEIEHLGEVARSTIRVGSQPDAQRIRLASATGAGPWGTLLYSPTSTELVVVAEGLTPTTGTQEYRCWVEIGSVRTPIGKMFFGGNLAYWVGDVPSVATLGADSRFGVNLIDLATPDKPGQPVLVGS